ncbi:hypothetical protein [Leifsonia sp. A12D58]|uniref:hypothetical protein n=1 Tax=Leifsonia sp. A12D58 TaxID=3397674 RepID=UPI0039E1FB8A
MSAETVFADLSSELAEAGASVGELFGASALVLDGKAFACLHNDSIALKLGEGSDAHQLALGLPGAILWDPSGQQHPFKDWVAVPVALNAEFEETQIGDLAPAAMAFLTASPA